MSLSPQALNPLKAMPNEPQKWFAETKGKLTWLRSELRERHQKEKQLRCSIKEVMETGMTDRQLLLTNESQRPMNTLDEVYGLADSHKRADLYNNFPSKSPHQTGVYT